MSSGTGVGWGALVLALGLLGCDGPESNDAGPSDASDMPDVATDDLVAEAGDSFYATVGETVRLDGSASVGASVYQWDFGDGRGWDSARTESVAELIYASPGRYRAFLTVFDGSARMRVDSLVVHVTDPSVHTPVASGSVAVWAAREQVAVVSPDSDELAIFSYAGGLTLIRRVSTGDEPRTVTVFEDHWVVVCSAADEVDRIDADGALVRIAMPPASRPHGAVGLGDALFVTLSSTGEVARVEADVVTALFPAIEDARGIATLPDGRLIVTRWRSPDGGGRMAALSPDGSGLETWDLAYDPQPGSDTESGGVPTYLDQVAVSPTGRLAVVPSLQASIGEGLFVSPRRLTFQTTVRGALSYLDPAGGEEDFPRRKLFDNRGFASSAIFSSRGDFVYIAMRGSRAVERIDVLSGAQSGSILDLGFAPQGLGVSPDGRLLFVDAYLSRELVMYEIGDPSALPRELQRQAIPTTEPLSAELLRGAILFNDSLDLRLSSDSYIACAHCHLDGRSDHRTWDFTDRGEGLRNTIDLLGRAGVGHGPLHWSANFDEVQDFEHDMRGPFAGSGLLSDAEFHSGTRDQTLGDTKAGVNVDLDALAAYVTSLDTHLPSPHRDSDGSLPDDALRGRALFAAAGCPTCHVGATLTDSGFDSPAVPRLHDVGTLGAGSGQRLGGALPGIDTPTLHGLWQSAPYLHDGSARTLREILTTRNPSDQHGVTTPLSSSEVDDLVAYLRCLDGRAD